MKTHGLILLMLVLLTAPVFMLESAYADTAAEMARKLQDPLANIKAIMTDNVIGFDTGDDEGTSYSFQLQPVYAINSKSIPGAYLAYNAVITPTGKPPKTTPGPCRWAFPLTEPLIWAKVMGLMS